MNNNNNNNNIPQKIEHYFKIKDVNFKTSVFEEMMLQDVLQYDQKQAEKLHRDVSGEFLKEIKMFIEEKRNIRYVVMGATRTGKSLSALKIGSIIMNEQGRDFNNDIKKIVCSNQIEYREKLRKAQFGDFYLVDESSVQQGGLGSNIEQSQLKDYNSIIAKQNISVIFIHPERFMPIGATLGFSTFGRDSKNWLSKMLLYTFKNSFTHLIGYIIIDIGDLFRKNGCFIYKFTGGCNNILKQKIEDIPKEIIKYSFCIPKNYDKNLIVTTNKTCPFYDVCTHGLCQYEHKKDEWIGDIMKGKLDKRTEERYKLSLILILDFMDEVNIGKGSIRLNAKNSKDLSNRVKLKLPKYTNTKMGIGEFDDFIEIIKTNTSIDMLVETLRILDDDKIKDKFFNLENYGEYIKDVYEKTIKDNENTDEDL